MALGVDQPADAQTATPPGAPTSTDTQCDWTETDGKYDTGTATPVTFDVREFVAADAFGAGAPVDGFTYLVNLDNAADPFNPNGDLHPITQAMQSNAPIVVPPAPMGTTVL